MLEKQIEADFRNARESTGPKTSSVINLVKKHDQLVLFLSHWFIYETWMDFRTPPHPAADWGLAMALAALSITYFIASQLTRHYSNLFVRLYYKMTLIWLGFLSFLFLAAVACWIVYGAAELFDLHLQRQSISLSLFGVAILVGAYGLHNSARIRVKQISVKLPNLPVTWRGRVAALVTDMHLGHVRGNRFARRIVNILSRRHPDIVLIAGDMFDGISADVGKLAEPFANLSAPLGAYFIVGNQEELYEPIKYLEAVRNAGVRVLKNEKVVVDGLQIVGVNHRDSFSSRRFLSVLRDADLDPEKASILLTHAPNQMAIAAEEKIGLQLSGHTHGGQFFPFTWIMSRTYGPFVYGLSRFGRLLVYTSCGVGTWGPPMRVGTQPEIVLIRFD